MKVIPFTVPFCSTSDPNFPSSNLSILTTTPVGWMSARFCTYPQELLIQFQTNIFIKKIQLLSNEKKISTKVEVYVGRLGKEQTQYLSVLGTDSIKFQKIGYFTFNANEQQNWQSRELKTVNIDQENCNFIRLMLSKNYDNRYNPFSQVGLIALRVYGEFQQLKPPSQAKPRFQDFQAAFIMKENEQKDERYIDVQTLQQIYALQYRKDFAIKEEDFEEAKNLKLQIDDLKRYGIQLKELEDKKALAIRNEDFDKAQELKKNIYDVRVQIGQIDNTGNQIKPSTNYLKKYPSFSNKNQDDQQQIKQNNISRQDRQLAPLNFTNEINEEPSEVINQSEAQNDSSFQRKNISYDDQIIPTLANKIKVDEDHKEQESNELEPAEELSIQGQKLAEPLIPIFTLEFCKKIFSKQWIQREQAFIWLQQELKTPNNIKTDPKEQFLQYSLQIISQSIIDKNGRVSTASIQTLQTLLQFFDFKQEQGQNKGEIPILLDNILLALLEKLGDTNQRLKDESEKTIYLLADSQVAGQQIVINHLIRGITIKPKLQQSARHINARLQIIYQLLKKNKQKNDKSPNYQIIEFALKYLDHPAENVRTSSIYIIGELYRAQGQSVRQSISNSNVRSSILQVLEELFQKIDSGQNIEGAFNPEKLRKQAVEQNLEKNKQQQPPPKQKEQSKLEILASKTTTQCEFCGIVNKEFAQSNKLDLHLWRECWMLNACQSCAQVVEIPSLSEHLLFECDRKQEYRSCSRCGAAIKENELNSHLNSNVCQQGKGNVCCLCFTQINDKENWRIHLKLCEKNERRVTTEN